MKRDSLEIHATTAKKSYTQKLELKLKTNYVACYRLSLTHEVECIMSLATA